MSSPLTCFQSACSVYNSKVCRWYLFSSSGIFLMPLFYSNWTVWTKSNNLKLNSDKSHELPCFSGFPIVSVNRILNMSIPGINLRGYFCFTDHISEVFSTCLCLLSIRHTDPQDLWPFSWIAQPCHSGYHLMTTALCRLSLLSTFEDRARIERLLSRLITELPTFWLPFLSKSSLQSWSESSWICHLRFPLSGVQYAPLYFPDDLVYANASTYQTFLSKTPRIL